MLKEVCSVQTTKNNTVKHHLKTTLKLRLPHQHHRFRDRLSSFALYFISIMRPPYYEDQLSSDPTGGLIIKGQL